MARISIRSEQVQRLISVKILPLLLVTGNVASLTKLLNDTLFAQDVKDRLHANRLHALLSNDITRSLNEATFALTEKAATAAFEADETINERAAVEFASLKARADKLIAFSVNTIEEIANRLSVSPALALELLNQTPEKSRASGGPAMHIPTIATSREPPDWGYQDTAVARCLEAFARRPAGRIGLVLPTGAGKTRTALRVVLAMLDKSSDGKASAYWVTHRRNLRDQAHRELKKLIAIQNDRRECDRLLELSSRIKFVMVGDLKPLLASSNIRPTLVIVDEAHHAAAPSYEYVFANSWAAPVLLLTATPNRGDRLPIGIDEIAFTITYRELAERRAVLIPTFLDFPIDNFDWSTEAIEDLADYVIDRASTDFTKVLVLAPRIDRVEEFYSELLAKLPGDHLLEADDIGFIHGGGNALGIDNEDFLARFGNKPRAIIVSAQLLLEGFDDPSINAVVLTYPSSSVIRLMQAAGRCVRYAPDKYSAYVVQARNDSIAYHFDQRWLYHEIDDYLRPQLVDIEYGNHTELYEKIKLLLGQHRVDQKIVQRTLERIKSLVPGDKCRLFFYGLPYFDAVEKFGDESKWGVSLEVMETSEMLRGIFNSFCALGADLSDPSDFLIREGTQFGLAKDLTTGSRWIEMSALLTAAYFAKREVHGPTPIDTMGTRPFKRHGATSWLRYISFEFRPAVPSALSDFLRDCHNALHIESIYLRTPMRFSIAVKIPLPLAGMEAFLLTPEAGEELVNAIGDLRQTLAEVEPGDQFGSLAAYIYNSDSSFIPARLLHRIESLLDPHNRAPRVLGLNGAHDIHTKEDLNYV